MWAASGKVVLALAQGALGRDSGIPVGRPEREMYTRCLYAFFRAVKRSKIFDSAVWAVQSCTHLYYCIRYNCRQRHGRQTRACQCYVQDCAPQAMTDCAPCKRAPCHRFTMNGSASASARVPRPTCCGRRGARDGPPLLTAALRDQQHPWRKQAPRRPAVRARHTSRRAPRAACARVHSPSPKLRTCAPRLRPRWSACARAAVWARPRPCRARAWPGVTRARPACVPTPATRPLTWPLTRPATTTAAVKMGEERGGGPQSHALARQRECQMMAAAARVRLCTPCRRATGVRGSRTGRTWSQGAALGEGGSDAALRCVCLRVFEHLLVLVACWGCGTRAKSPANSAEGGVKITNYSGVQLG